MVVHRKSKKSGVAKSSLARITTIRQLCQHLHPSMYQEKAHHQEENQQIQKEEVAQEEIQKTLSSTDPRIFHENS